MAIQYGLKGLCMSSSQSDSIASLTVSEDNKTLHCLGTWTLTHIESLETQFQSLQKIAPQITILDGSDIANMDSAGALMLQNILDHLKEQGERVGVTDLNKRFQSLLNLVSKETQKIHEPVTTPGRANWFYRVGEWAADKYWQILDFLTFSGELIVIILRSIAKPRKIQWRSTLVAIDVTGYQALPIVALMSFLIGIVLAYQLAEQLRVYGAEIFIVDVTGIAILREFAPLITAIIIAGRTATSFAALIGTMKVNEEIDALQTMGLSPVERLVLPRIFGLIIALPLLVVWADLFGIFGSMVMSKYMLGIGFHAYLERFEFAVALKHYVLGLIKTPVFALIIASVGCFQGFQVETSAESVGFKTTKAAVQAIFLIIIADAVFSIIFNEMGY